MFQNKPNPYEKISYHDFSSDEERYAFEIWHVIEKYMKANFPEKTVNNLNFEILSKSQMTGKRHLISISLRYHSIQLAALHIHMMTFGISKKFIDKSSSELEKKYLSVWI